ncbi:MAG TPA: methyltransferase [Verrucomicrobiae bacterium]|nr:methyltransferase [Verrucomicrobiae bacterium]
MPPVNGLLHQLKRRIRKFKTAFAGPDLNTLLNGYRSTALLYLAAKLKIPDQLTHGPIAAADLAKRLRVHPPSLHRLLRGLAAFGICTEDNEGHFQLTEMGNRLRSDSAGPEYSLALLNGEEYAPAWNHLLHSIQTGETAFDHAFNQTVWEHRESAPGMNDAFNQWLQRGAGDAGRFLFEAYDFSPFKKIADLGGGNGSLLAALLKKHSSANGILFDQVHVLQVAEKNLEAAGVRSRCEFVPGNFFEHVPAGAEIYILKSILHDWNDAQCATILKNCAASLKPGNALLVIEKLLPNRATENQSVVMSDLHMLAVTGGLERTAAEYGSLLQDAGFSLRKVIPLRTGHSLLEAIRV